MITQEQFWMMADETRLETEYLADEQLKAVASASLTELQNIFLQYRYFTKQYPNNVGVLISKTPPGHFKSLMAEILSEELGDGDNENSHLKIWDDFLISLGINADILETSANPENQKILEERWKLTFTKPLPYVIGLWGMGGECLCQVYLTAVYKNLLKNPYIKANKDQIDWVFWDIHTGEADIRHRQLVKKAINDILEDDPDIIQELAEGYQNAKNLWETFWSNNYTSARQLELLAVA